MSENTASSTSLGSRSIFSQMRSNSASVSPSASARSTVRMGHREEDLQPVVRSGERVDGVLGVRHQPEDVAGGVAHAGDVVGGPVGVAIVGVLQEDLAMCVEALQILRWRVVA